MDVIAAEQREGVLLLTFDRPERRNAMVPELMAELRDHLLGLRARPDAPRAVVLTGAPPAFCVGADIKWFASHADPGEAVAVLVAAHHEAVRAMLDSPVPIIAAVNGAAAGGGMSLALAADYRVASSIATFTAAYFRLGLPPDGGNSALLVRAMGASRTMDLLLSNRSLSAEEARAWGLVNEVVAPEGLVEQACVRAESFAGVPPETLLATRRLLEAATTRPLTAQLDAEQAAMTTAARRAEFGRALRAFLEKQSRRPGSA